ARFLGIALFREAGFRALASVAQHLIDIPTQQRGDVDLHFFPLQIGIADDVAIDWAGLVLREHDGGLGTDARAGGAVGFAIVIVLDLDAMLLIHSIDADQTETQALHAIRAAIVINDREPGFPFT